MGKGETSFEERINWLDPMTVARTVAKPFYVADGTSHIGRSLPALTSSAIRIYLPNDFVLGQWRREILLGNRMKISNQSSATRD